MRADLADGPTCAPPGVAPGAAYTLTALGCLAHTITEMTSLPGWAQARGIDVTQAQFGAAALSLALAAMALLVAGRMFQFTRGFQRVIAVLCGGLLSNVAVHAAVSLASFSVIPGLWSGLLFVLPPTLWLFWRLPLTGREKAGGLATGAVLMPGIAGAALWLAG